MKRFLLALAFLLLPSLAQAAHFNCTLNSSCTTAAPCDWATAGNWSSCNSDYPHNAANTFTATIAASRTVILSTDAISIGLSSQSTAALNIDGTFIMSNSASGRDANGFRSLTLVPNNDGINRTITGSTAGVLRAGAGNRLIIDTTAGNKGTFDLAQGFTWDTQGSVVDSQVELIGTPAVNNTLCGSATIAQYYVLGVKKGIESAQVGRRVLFKTGQLRNFQFEIASVDSDVNDLCLASGSPLPNCTGAGTGTYLGYAGIGICTEMADSTSLTCSANHSCGQRLTPHATIGVFPNGNMTVPTAASATTRHWTVWPTTVVNLCTAAHQPHPFCTGANTGTAMQIVPLVGDKIAIIDDVWITQTGGTAGWLLSGSSMTTMPRIKAANLAGGSMSISSSGVPATNTTYPFSYNNAHDYVGGAFTFTGWQGHTIQWSACHDALSTALDTAGCFTYGPISNTVGPTSDGNQILDSIIYRARGNGVNFNSSANQIAASGCKILRNRVLEGCTTTNSECGGLELNACSGAEVAYNEVWDISPITTGSNTNGNCYRMGTDPGAPSTSNNGTVFHHNIGVNCARNGLAIDNSNRGQKVSVTANYFSNTGWYSVMGGKDYGNFVRNADLWKNGNPAFYFPAAAYGNFIEMQDPTTESTYCAGGCSAIGIETGAEATIFSDDQPVTMSDNTVKALSNKSIVAGIYVTGDHTGALTFAHNTFDANGRTSGGVVDFRDSPQWSPSIATAATVTDSAATYGNDGQAVYCSTDAEALVTVGIYVGNRSATAAERISNTTPVGNPGNCVSTGTRYEAGPGLGFVDRVNLDYTLEPGSPILTQASDGGALGSRAFRFNFDALTQLWGGVFPFNQSAGDATGESRTPLPKDFSNGTCSGVTSCNQDTDGDGVMDIHDNCRYTWNPSQWDGDADGKGCACDSGDTCP